MTKVEARGLCRTREPFDGTRAARGALETRVTPPTGPAGKVTFSCDIHPGTIQTLVKFGWLHPGQQHDLAAIVSAFRGFAGRALDVARNGGQGRWYFP